MAEDHIQAAVDAAFVEAPIHQHGIYVALRDEKDYFQARLHYFNGKCSRKQHIPKPGDLVRVCHTIVFSRPALLMIEKLALNME